MDQGWGARQPDSVIPAALRATLGRFARPRAAETCLGAGALALSGQYDLLDASDFPIN